MIGRRRPAPAQPPPEQFGYRAVLEASPNAILAIDASSIITYANPRVATTFGYEPGELLGQSFEILLPERVREKHVEHRAGYLAHPVARPIGIGMDVSGRRKDGSDVPVEVSLWPVETPDGLQVFASVIDITARKAAETQLLQAQKLESIGRLAGGVAHDFNNMLFAILGYAELLEQDLAPDRRHDLDAERALRNIRGINLAADRAATLTRQLLAFSRQQVVSPEVVAVNDAVHQIDPMLRRLIGENVRLVTRLGPETGRIRVDPGQLDQILVNLVVNARDAMPAGGTVTIETCNVVVDEPHAIELFDVAAGAFVTVVVSDTGEGMDAETQRHAFEPFFTTKELGKGTGLGLATIYGIVRQAGGHIALESKPGKGTTFKVYFPCIEDGAAERPATALAPSAGAGGTILIVEDEPTVREMTRSLLERAGFAVVAVGSGAEAMGAIGTIGREIDVVVSDVVMAGMSGTEVADQVMDIYPRIAVVLLSGYTAETLNLDRIIGRGAAFLAKPVSGNDLIHAIRAGMKRV